MADSYITYPGDGVQRDFVVPFPYLDRSHVSLTVNDTPAAFTWFSSTILRASVVPAFGSTVTVRRTTPTDERLIEFQNGSALSDTDLNLATEQPLFIAQEAADEIKVTLLPEAQDARDAAVAAKEDAEAANNGAQAALSSVLDTVGMGTDRRVYGSVAELLADNVPAHISQVSVLGYASAADWGGFTATRSTTPPSHQGVWTSADGAKWVHADPEVHFETWGAVGNGTTNDIVAVGKALTVGKPARGLSGRWYGVAGNVTLSSGATVEDAKFRQLTHTGPDRRTLLSSGANNITLRRVVVDRNGDGAYGAINDDAAIWLASGAGHLLEDVEVFGQDRGNGVTLQGCSGFMVTRPHIHGLKYVSATDPGDDRVNGIWLNDCTNFVVSEPKVYDLGGTIGGVATTRWSRGIAVSGCSDWSISGGHAYDLDQGVDVTGGMGNRRFRITAMASSRCRSWGFKLANTAIEGQLTGCIGTDCGYASFVVSGPAGAGLPLPRDITMTSCMSVNVGSNGVYAANQPSGFLILQGAFDTSYPRPVRLVSCSAVDNQAVPTMAWGARNQINNTGPGQPYNKLEDFTSRGHTLGASSGFQYPAAKLRRTSALSLANNNAVLVPWDAEFYDGCNLHSTTSNTETLTGFEPGWYRVSARAGFAAAAAGKRQLWIRVNGVNYDDTMAQASGTSGMDTILSTSGVFYLTEAGVVSAGVLQDSGGSLNLLHAYSTLEVAPAMNQNAAP